MYGGPAFFWCCLFWRHFVSAMGVRWVLTPIEFCGQDRPAYHNVKRQVRVCLAKGFASTSALMSSSKRILQNILKTLRGFRPEASVNGWLQS